MLKAIKRFFVEKTTSREVVKETIEKIHNEFDGAGEKLLAQAKLILSKEEDITKGERLKQLGFISAKPSVRATQVSKEKSQSKHVSERVEYFQHHYPSNKFITEEIVEQICKKYGLVCGDAVSYIGNVPTKNITEMEDFKLKDLDCISHKCSYHRIMSGGALGYYYYPVSEAAAGHYGYMSKSGLLVPVKTEIEVFYEKPSFKICAPIKDFDLSRKEVKNGYKLCDIPDPIVLQPVEGGYLIVSKWGLEGNDELVINQKMN